MDLMKLKYFYSIAKYENISSASKELLISQSALSKAIRCLENELEMDLFYRNGKSISLNDNGKLLFKQADRIFNELDDLHKIMDEQRTQGDGRLSIITTLPYTFTNLITSFIQEFPSFYYEQLNLSKKNMDLFIEHGKFDACLTTQQIDHPNVSWIPLTQEDIYLTVPDSYPAATFSEIYLKDLVDMPFIGLTQSYAYRQLMDQKCAEIEFEPNYRIELEESTAVLQLVKNGFGAAFMPQSSLSLLDDSVKYLHIADSVFKRDIGLVVHNNRYKPEILNQFIQHCHTFFDAFSNEHFSA